MTVYNTMVEKYGMDCKEAANCFYIIDKDGLITKSRKNLNELKANFDDIELFAKDDSKIEGLKLNEVTKLIKPTVLIGIIFDILYNSKGLSA